GRARGPSISAPFHVIAALMGAPSSSARHFPTALKFSNAKPSGSMLAWQLAHTALLRCCSIRSRREAGLLFPSFCLSGGTFGGGGGGGAPSSVSSTHLPRKTTEVRCAYEVTVSTLAWPRMPLRRSSVTWTLRKWLPNTPGIL